MALNLINWVITDSTAYKALQTKDTNSLYFLSDTGEIYRGTASFSEAVVFYTGDLPTEGIAQGKLYVNSTTLEGQVYNGTGWTSVVKPIAQTIDHDDPTANPVSGAAVKSYVADRIAAVNGNFVTEVGWNSDTKSVTFVKGGETQSVKLSTVITGASYDGSTGKVSMTDVDGTEVTSFNIPLDNFVQSGSYDEETQALVLVMQNGSEVSIPAADLIDIYTTGDTSTVKMAIDTADNNKITANVQVSAETGNALSIKDDGLFCSLTDISGKMDLVALDKAGEILVAKADGHAEVSGLKAGGDTLAATPNGTTLATEAAVQAVKTAIEQNAATTYVNKNQVVQEVSDAETASDIEIPSEIAVREAIDAAVELAVQNAATAGDLVYVAKTDVVASADDLNTASPSATRIVSESALLNSLTWKTL